MREDEYPALAADPTAYLMETWLPRTQSRICKPGQPATVANQMAWMKGGMALMQYFTAFGDAVDGGFERVKRVTELDGLEACGFLAESRDPRVGFRDKSQFFYLLIPALLSGHDFTKVTNYRQELEIDRAVHEVAYEYSGAGAGYRTLGNRP